MAVCEIVYPETYEDGKPKTGGLCDPRMVCDLALAVWLTIFRVSWSAAVVSSVRSVLAPRQNALVTSGNFNYFAMYAETSH